MSGLEIWLRVTALVFAAAVIGMLGPAPGLEHALLVSSSIAELAKGLRWHEDAAHLYSLRAFYLFDFLFLLAHGFFFHRLLKRKGAAIFMMGADAVENIAALYLINEVVLSAEGGSIWRGVFASAFYAKWVAVAWTYFECSRLPAMGWALLIRRFALWCGAAAAIIYAAAFRFQPTPVGVIAGYAVAGCLGAVLFTTIRAIPQASLPLRSLFFLRVPLIAMGVAAVAAAAAFGPLRAFLFAVLHFYDTRTGPWGFLIAAALAYFLALLVPFQARIVLVHGVQRFGLPTVGQTKLRRILLFFQNSMVAGITVLLGGCVAMSWGAWAWQYSLVVLALVTAGVLFALADWIAGWLTAKPLDLPLLLLPGRFGGWWKRALKKPGAEPVPAIVDWLSGVIARQRMFRPPGYFDADGYLYPAHVGGIGLMAVAVGIFAAIVIWVWIKDLPPPQSLASFSFLGIVITGVVSGMAFYFDRHRVPLLLVLVLLRTAVGMPDFMDNVFVAAAEKESKLPYSSPGQVLARFAGKEAILIAASGGGIQAASWMAHVIHKLDEEKSLRDRVALISAVSGGSVGAYHLGDGWKNADWGKAETAVQESSLGPMTSALLGPDLFRPFVAWLPFGKYLDRGFALEASIEQHQRKSTGNPADFTMDDWAFDVAMPAMLFNTTVVETGGPVAFATTELLSEAYRSKVKNPMDVKHPVEGWRGLVRCYGTKATSRNIKVSTAARLSATFPYVSPAAKLEGAPDALAYHFVDGGYYDNYGVVAMLQWLDEALEELPPEKLPSSIRILVIRGAVPGDGPATGKRADQLTAPAEAFLNMRSYAQWSGAAAAIRLITVKWEKKATFEDPELLAYPDLRKVSPACSEEPLTWKLTTAQKECISVGWRNLKRKRPE